jgi:hypothetical protein
MKSQKSSEQLEIAAVGVGTVDISCSCGPLEAKVIQVGLKRCLMS